MANVQSLDPVRRPPLKVAVLADCHIHPGGGPNWTPAILDALAGVDLILTLGDMGEASGLDRLAEIAPVLGVAGRDDEGDPRTAFPHRVFETIGLRIGCVFDPVEAGLAASLDPFTPSDQWASRHTQMFAGRVDVLLCASTHKAAFESVGPVLVINPGSATLPESGEDGAPGTFVVLELDGGGAQGRLVQVPR